MRSVRGVSLIDVVISTALILIVFLALFGLLRASLLVSAMVKSESTATAIANNQMEYIRSLPYSSVGTVGGIPSGLIPQNATTTEDGVPYGVRTFIEYYDDPADGLGSADTNGITTDYKKIKIIVTFSTGTHMKQIALNSNYAPPGLETTSGGGTLQIKVVNATGAPVSGASVHIVNASTTPTIDVTTFSDTTGTVSLPGAATSTQYAITVSKSGYSTAQTYARDTNNQNPTPGYLTVVQNQTTTGTFAIDTLGTLTINTFSPVVSGSFVDPFIDTTKLASQTNIAVSGGVMSLSGGAGNYALIGTASSIVTAPTRLASWGVASTTASIPAGTNALLRVVDGSGNLLPDSVLPGNSAGFSTFPVDLSSVSTSSYPALALTATLSSNSSAVTPTFSVWTITYKTGPTPLPNVAFTLSGAKTIGSTGGGAPIYKTLQNSSSGTTGSISLPLEWDSYGLTIPSYDVQDACGAPPYALSPGASLSESLILGTQTTNSALIFVTDSSGNVVPGASVTLSRSGYSKTVTSSACGAAYFGGVSSANDYSVMISKSGYTSNTVSGVSISGETFYGISF